MRKIIIFAVVSAVLLAGCSKKPDTVEQPPVTEQGESEVKVQEQAEDTDVREEAAVPQRERSMINEAAWCVYWDPDSAAAAVDNYTRYKELVLFGCVYSEDHTLSVPEQLGGIMADLPGKTSADCPELYLSFINDVIHPDGSSTQKSTDFLQEVLTDGDLSDAVINDMIEQTQSFGFDGIELDYENIHKCDDLWDEYIDFVTRLYQRADSVNLKLRVILTVSTPVEELDLVRGPRYVVMCYNLYGNHSGPGPKADGDFLKDTYDKFSSIDADYALANGGFEWGPDDKAIRSLTAKAAKALADETGAEMTRDNNGAVSYTYRSEDGLHTVCYSDEETIERWSEILLENADKDIRINLWRLE